MKKKRLNKKHLVSLNTARIKLKNQHPRISQDLKQIFDTLKELSDKDGTIKNEYNNDGLLNIND